VRKLIYEYDKMRHRTKWLGYDSTGNLYESGTYKYDEKGNVLETHNILPDGSLCCLFSYKNDEQGNVYRIKGVNPNNKWSIKHINNYDGE